MSCLYVDPLPLVFHPRLYREEPASFAFERHAFPESREGLADPCVFYEARLPFLSGGMPGLRAGHGRTPTLTGIQAFRAGLRDVSYRERVAAEWDEGLDSLFTLVADNWEITLAVLAGVSALAVAANIAAIPALSGVTALLAGVTLYGSGAGSLSLLTGITAVSEGLCALILYGGAFSGAWLAASGYSNGYKEYRSDPYSDAWKQIVRNDFWVGVYSVLAVALTAGGQGLVGKAFTAMKASSATPSTSPSPWAGLILPMGGAVLHSADEIMGAQSFFNNNGLK